MLRILNTAGSPGGRGTAHRCSLPAALALAGLLAACGSLPQQGSDGSAPPVFPTASGEGGYEAYGAVQPQAGVDPTAVETGPAAGVVTDTAGAQADADTAAAAGDSAENETEPAQAAGGTVYHPPVPYALTGLGPDELQDAASFDEIAQMNLARRDLWGRIRAGFAMPELDTPLVAQKEKFYLDRPDYLNRMFDRGARYLHYIVEEIEKRGMPTELALLPFVESAMNPVALSSAKAAGLWQFIPSTGRQYDLSQNWWVDNRRDVVQSTRAALDYLQTIYQMHGNDWFLALASYNWGEIAVGRAIKRNKKAGKGTDYLSLRMPRETRHYVPKLIALKHIVMQADELGLTLPALPDKAYFVTVEKTRPIDLKLAAEFAQMSVADFVALNPAHNRPVIAASKNNVLKIPADKIDAFTSAMVRHDMAEKVFASWQPYTLKPGESIADVASRGGITTEELLQANSISPKVRVLAGTRILAPLDDVEDESLVEDFAGARIYQQVRMPALYHRVKRRETASSIARRYGVTLSQLTAMNGNLSKLRTGTRLLVRRPTTQTVLVTENGNRQVVRGRGPVIVQASGGGAAKASVRTVSTAGKAQPRKRAATRPAASKPAARPAARSKTPVTGKTAPKVPKTTSAGNGPIARGG